MDFYCLWAGRNWVFGTNISGLNDETKLPKPYECIPNLLLYEFPKKSQQSYQEFWKPEKKWLGCSPVWRNPSRKGSNQLGLLGVPRSRKQVWIMYAFLNNSPHSPMERSFGIVTVRRCWGMVCYHGSVGCGSQPTQGHRHHWHKNCAHIYHRKDTCPHPLLLIYFKRIVNYCTFILWTHRFLNDVLSRFSNSSFLGLLVIQMTN